MSEPDNIADVLKTYIQNKNIAKKINSHKIFNYWSAIVGRDISQHAKPKMLRNNVLYISTSNHIWSTELGMMSQDIIGKINAFLNDEVVRELRIRPDLK